MIHHYVNHGIFTEVEHRLRLMNHIAFEILVNNLVSTFFSELLRSLIAFQLVLKRVKGVSEEACDADGIYVIFQNQKWGKVLKY